MSNTTSGTAVKNKYGKMQKKENLNSFLFLLPYGLLFSLFVLVPVIVAIGLSLTYFNVVGKVEFSGVGNYITMITQDDVFFKNILPNTVRFSLIVGPGGFLLSFLLAWMLAQIQPVPRTIFALACYTPSLAGGVFISVIWRTIFSGSQNGYINAFLMQNNLIDKPIQFYGYQSPEYLMNIMIFVSLWSAMGIGFLSMLAGILNINEELYEAAYIDGIRNRFQEIIYITIPSLKPQMLFASVMAIVGAFNNGAIGVQLSGGNPTFQYSGSVIINHIEDYAFLRYEMGYAAALSVALLGIIWVFSKFAYKFFSDSDK